MKKCPMCDEDIADKAIVCKHCGSKFQKNGLEKYIIPALIIILVGIVGFGIYYVNTPHFWEKRDCHSQVSEQMKDPNSLEFIGDDSVDNTPISGHGVQVSQITISGKYRAKNSFGGMDVGEFVCNRMGDDGKMTVQVGENMDAYRQGLNIVTGSGKSYSEKIDSINNLAQ